MTLAERDLEFRDPPGSNGFAIAPSHTKDGHALLLINPHTQLLFPLRAADDERCGLNAYGAATWGQFFIYQGLQCQRRVDAHLQRRRQRG